MKIWELEEGKIYKDQDEDKFKIKNKKLYCNICTEGLGWDTSVLSYNYVMDMDFEEVKRELDWYKVPFMTKVMAKISNDEDKSFEHWRNAYFIKYNEKNEKKFIVTFCDEFTYIGELSNVCFKEIKLHESVKPKDNWFK